jgi:Tfp pilus assembly protein PilF
MWHSALLLKAKVALDLDRDTSVASRNLMKAYSLQKQSSEICNTEWLELMIKLQKLRGDFAQALEYSRRLITRKDTCIRVVLEHITLLG